MNMRLPSAVLFRRLAAACLAAGLVVLSDGLPVVHAIIPYYPYECPVGSGGTDFDGTGYQQGIGGVPSWDPKNGLWFSSNQGDNPVWGTWGDIPTPGDFDGDLYDNFAVFRPSIGTWFVRVCLPVACPGGSITVQWGTAGDIPVPADYDDDGFTDYGVWRPSNGAWYVRSGASGATLVNGVTWGQYGDCPIAARISPTGPGPLHLNVFRPSNGVWYIGRSLSGTGGATYPFGTYGDIPSAPALGGGGVGKLVVFRPSTGTWYGADPPFSIAWGQPGDIPLPLSLFGEDQVYPSALRVYRPTTRMTYNCFVPMGSVCQGGTSVEGPSGASGAVPLQGRWK